MAKPNYLHAENAERRSRNMREGEKGLQRLNEVKVNTTGFMAELLALDANNGWGKDEANSNSPKACTIGEKCF